MSKSICKKCKYNSCDLWSIGDGKYRIKVSLICLYTLKKEPVKPLLFSSLGIFLTFYFLNVSSLVGSNNLIQSVRILWSFLCRGIMLIQLLQEAIETALVVKWLGATHYWDILRPSLSNLWPSSYVGLSFMVTSGYFLIP